MLNLKKNELDLYYENISHEIIKGNKLLNKKDITVFNSSLLPIHSDVWSGCSPFEVVLWVPLVDVYDSKSMFIFPKNINDNIYKKFSLYKNS